MYYDSRTNNETCSSKHERGIIHTQMLTNAQSAGLRSLVPAESGLQQPMQRMCNMQVSNRVATFEKKIAGQWERWAGFDRFGEGIREGVPMLEIFIIFTLKIM